MSTLKSKEPNNNFDQSINNRSYFSNQPNSTQDTNSCQSKGKNINYAESKEYFNSQKETNDKFAKTIIS